jgi:hypothetical protein
MLGDPPAMDHTERLFTARELHEAIVRLSPWLQHHRCCARVVAITDCDCGLQAALAPYQWRI